MNFFHPRSSYEHQSWPLRRVKERPSCERFNIIAYASTAFIIYFIRLILLAQRVCTFSLHLSYLTQPETITRSALRLIYVYLYGEMFLMFCFALALLAYVMVFIFRRFRVYFISNKKRKRERVRESEIEVNVLTRAAVKGSALLKNNRTHESFSRKQFSIPTFVGKTA